MIARTKELGRTIRQHPLILPLYLPTLLIAFSWGVREPILPLYIRDFNVSYNVVGLVLAAMHLGMLATDLPSGLLMARFGKRRLMILGIACGTVGSAGLLWAGSIPVVFACRLLSGFGYAVYSLARHTFLADAVPIHSRGRVVAFFGGLFRIGRFAGPAMGGFVAAQLGLRMPFLLMAGLNAAALLVIFLTMPGDDHPALEETLSLSAYLNQLKNTFVENRRVMLPVGLGQLLAQMVRTAPSAIIPLFAADILNLDVQQIGLIISIGAAIDMVMFYPTGVIMDRFGRKFAVVPSFLLQGLGVIMIPLAGGFAGMVAAAGVIGFGNGLGSGTMMTLGADLAPPDQRGPFLGMWRLIGDTGFMIGPLVVGSVAGALALPAAAVVTGSGGLLASLVFLLLVPETLRRKR